MPFSNPFSHQLKEDEKEKEEDKHIKVTKKPYLCTLICSIE